MVILNCLSQPLEEIFMLRKSLGLVLALGFIGSAYAEVKRETVSKKVDGICNRLGTDVSAVKQADLDKFLSKNLKKFTANNSLENDATFSTTLSETPTMKEFCARLREVAEKGAEAKLKSINARLRGLDKGIDNLIKPSKEKTEKHEESSEEEMTE